MSNRYGQRRPMLKRRTPNRPIENVKPNMVRREDEVRLTPEQRERSKLAGEIFKLGQKIHRYILKYPQVKIPAFPNHSGHATIETLTEQLKAQRARLEAFENFLAHRDVYELGA